MRAGDADDDACRVTAPRPADIGNGETSEFTANPDFDAVIRGRPQGHLGKND